MPTLGQRDFSSGWTPSDNEVQGDPKGLLRMDNLQLDERGAVTLTRGMNKISQTFTQPVQTVYSKILNGIKTRYVGTGDSGVANGGVITRSLNESTSFSQVPDMIAVHSVEHAYTSAMNYVLIASSTVKKKDDGTAFRDLGIEIPTAAPTVVVNPKQILDVSGDYLNYTLEEGTLLTNPKPEEVQFVTDVTTGRGVVQVEEGIDATAFIGGVTDSSDDIFRIHFKISDSAKLSNLRIEFMLVPPPPDPVTPASDYYFIDFPVTDPQWNIGTDIFSVLQAKRGDFVKEGNNATLNWSNIRAIRITLTSVSSMVVSFDVIVFEGGTGQLNGRYQYVQVNVHNDNERLSPSPVSAKSLTIVAASQSVKVTPNPPTKLGQFPTELNEIWIYRREIDTQPDYVFVAKRLDTSEFVDDISDRDALLGIDDLPDFVHHKANFFRIHPPDNIIQMEEMYFDRVSFLTSDKLYLSEAKNIDAVDSRHVFDVSGSRSELNLWVKKIPGTGLLLGTTNDIYEIRGTGNILEDGTIDFVLHPLGVSNPPISNAVSKQDNSIVYMASDGWRTLTGTGSENITGNTNLLYNEQDRFEIESVFIGVANQVNYDCAVSKNKLFTTVTLKDGVNRRCYVYDFPRGYWYPYFINPVVLFTEEDGTLLAGFGDAGNFFLREIDTTNKLDGNTNQQVVLRTTYIDNESPNTRKDVQVVKIYADTEDTLVNIRLRKDGGTIEENLGNFAFNGSTLKTIATGIDPATSVNLGKSFQLRITSLASGVSKFTFMYWSIDYEPRPEQLSILRIPPNNFGIAGRKRFYDLPFSINGFKNTYLVTPILDSTRRSDLARSFTGGGDEKGLRSIAFASEVIGIELGCEIKITNPTNGIFEFHELVKPRAIEVLPDFQRFHRIVITDLGTPARKKFTRLALDINTFGDPVTFTPLIDGISFPTLTVTTNSRQLFLYYFKVDARGIRVNGLLQSQTDDPFEFYDIDRENSTFQVMPLPSQFIKGETDFGTTARKRFSRISFICNFKGSSGIFTPITDGNRHPGISFTSFIKKTHDYYFTTDQKFVDLEYELDSSAHNKEFEFYKLLKPEILEVLPEPVKFFHIPVTNLGTPSRKRFIIVALIIDTKGSDVTYIPEIDGVVQSSLIINTSRKQTVIYYFTVDTKGTDLGGTLSGSQEFEFYDIDLDETISEKLPLPTKFLVIPESNLGTNARKRIVEFPLVIDTKGSAVTFTGSVDGIAQTPFVINTSRKQTITDFYNPTVIGVDFGGTLSGNTEFEFYGLIEKNVITEILPVPTKHLHIPYTNLGTSSRKHFVRIVLVIDTLGVDVTFTPEIDNVAQTDLIINTSSKDTVIYTFNKDIKGIEFSGTLSGTVEFEYYGLVGQETVFEVIPPIARFIQGTTNFGNVSRKRFSTLSFVCNPGGGTIRFTPIINGIRQVPSLHSGLRKETFPHYFGEDVTFIDLEYEILSLGIAASDGIIETFFEFYEIQQPEILEILPRPTKFHKIPTTNLGTDSRKRFITYAIVIDTKGQDVSLVPIIDGIRNTASTINTSGKRTAIHYFISDNKGTDIGAELTSLDDTEFEFYRLNPDEIISEKLPAPTKFLEIPANNFGVAGKKRIRTIPISIDTRGGTVTFTPKVDGISQVISTHVSSEKRTLLHFFEIDVFGIDFGGTLTSDTPFEFYGLLTPENVQLLPVAKKFDQIGPFSLDQGAWFKEFRLRIVPTGSLITWKFFLRDTEEDSGSIVVVPDIEDVYEINFIRALKGTVVRLELQSADGEFHRIGGEIRYGESGGATALKKFKFTNEMAQSFRT